MNRQANEKPIRVLHIGNVANNAYLNARILNDAGLDCDVLNHDYYHVMGYPEWEDADFVGRLSSELYPDWDALDLRGFSRPRWFAQGRFRICVEYLLAHRTGRPISARLYWLLLTLEPRLRRSGPARLLFKAVRATRSCARLFIGFRSLGRSHSDDGSHRLIDAFKAAFPERRDQLTSTDVSDPAYRGAVQALAPLFAQYDIVQAYGLTPVFPMLDGHSTYIAFEHGTIRNIPFEDNRQGRLTALAYHRAAGVVITNCDNRRAAERLKIADYRFVPHPVNERWTQKGIGSDLRQALCGEMDSDFVVFHPSRHHWETRRHPDWEKGNDIFIAGLARFMAEVAPRSSAVFVEWGQTVGESKALLRRLGVAGRVKWIPVEHSAKVARYIDASDVVADQFFLGAFGSITPRAMAMGKPPMLYVDEDMHRWCFPELPPVINVRTSDDVFAGLSRAYRDPRWRTDLGEAARMWYGKYHSNAVIRERLTRFYDDVLQRREAGHPGTKPSGPA
ncbi:MAG: hypothetical protein OJF52_002420 [Nitrospira sp.]|jgi:glycosyltransferase involved in cell wall biosynthesis|nr:MAG: hypothetical protein OJF52_002420 [Nitrospira sp.]